MLIPEQEREDQAIPAEERWQDIDFSELAVTSKDPNHRKYTPEEKIQCCTLYFLCGNMRKVEKDTGIQWQQINDWRRNSTWWSELTAKLRREKQDELDASITNFLHEAQSQALDRIKNGDFKLTASGELKRIPMSGKDIALASSTFFDKRALIRGDATSISKRTNPLENIKDKLEAFAKYTNATEIDGKRKMTYLDVTKRIQDGQRKEREQRTEANV